MRVGFFFSVMGRQEKGPTLKNDETFMEKLRIKGSTAGVQGKNNEYHIVDKVQNSFIDALIFDLIDNVVFDVFALYSRTAKEILEIGSKGLLCHFVV